MDKQWHRQLRREASVHSMCAENRYALEGVETKAEAIALYKKTIDWALEEGYPSLATIRRNFSDCENEGVFIDRHFDGEILTEHQVYIFHNCTGTIRTGLNLTKRLIPMLYFANGCDMSIRGIVGSKTQTIVPLYVFGDCCISGEQSNDIRCVTHKFDVK